jgi:hypothetical protein
MSTGNSEQKDNRHFDPDAPMVSNSAAAETNHGLQAGQINIYGPVTFNHSSSGSKGGMYTESMRSDMSSSKASEIHLSDADWSSLKRLTERLSFEGTQKSDLVRGLALAVKKDPDNDPWSGLVAMTCKHSFFEKLFYIIRTSENRELNRKLIDELDRITIHRDDKKFLCDLLNEENCEAERTDEGSETSGRDWILRATEEEFQICPSLANCLCNLAALQEEFIPNGKPATWLYKQISRRYDKCTEENLTTQQRDSLMNLMDIGTFIEMPLESHDLVVKEFKRAMEKRTEQLGGKESNAVDYGTEDREFIVFSYANALLSLGLETGRDGGREFPHGLIRAIRGVDFSARFKSRGKNAFRPVEFPASVYQIDPPSTKGRDLLIPIAAICSAILELDCRDPDEYSRRKEGPDAIINRFKINADTRPNRYIAICLNEEYCKGLIKEIRKKVPQLIVVPVSKSRQQVFQHLSEIRNSFVNILGENTNQ